MLLVFVIVTVIVSVHSLTLPAQEVILIILHLLIISEMAALAEVLLTHLTLIGTIVHLFVEVLESLQVIVVSIFEQEIFA